ncbi:lamin tail domain-containing protein [Streptomyces sp. NBC_01218]|uniref:lamin tail domain-containing protein n=1 Tax=Streptomyces sp. NBC_01218 TaxID=2903780 RepID=UPI002E10337C|nr:lamin tail domain-containing protein [Streptomyces sp. NBC_01218]
MSRTARRITATVLASGALLAAAALPAAADGHGRGHDRGHDRVQPAPRSSIVLGQIQYDSPGRDNRSNRSLNDEWVTVTNTSRQAVNLRGWTLTDESRRTYRFDLRLAGRSSVRVHTGVGRDSRTDVFQDRENYVWDNSDTATLRDARGRKIDQKAWGHRGGRDDHRGHDRDDHRGHGRGHDDNRGHGHDDNRGHDRDHRR